MKISAPTSDQVNTTLCDLCLVERRMGSDKDAAPARYRGRTREGLSDVPMCEAHRQRDGVGRMERI